MKIKTMIVEDEPVARKVLAEFMEDVGFLELVACAENPAKAMSILDNHPIDLIFLDINMPVLNGIDFLKSLKKVPEVVLTTAYPEYALDGYELDVVDYLLKPVAFDRFLRACLKARERIGLKKKINKPAQHLENHFYIKCDGAVQRVRFQDVLFAEARLNYVILHCVTGKLITYLTIKSLAAQLPSEQFIRVHKSYVVNTEQIKSIRGNCLHIGNADIPISQEMRESVLRHILKDRMIRREPVAKGQEGPDGDDPNQ